MVWVEVREGKGSTSPLRKKEGKGADDRRCKRKREKKWKAVSETLEKKRLQGGKKETWGSQFSRRGEKKYIISEVLTFSEER